MDKKSYFEGWYFKHQKGENTICFIVGKSEDNCFIQVVSKDFSKVVYYDLNEYYASKKHLQVRVGDSLFGINGCIVDIKSDDLTICGRITYSDVIKIKGDIMGPFRFLPKMECRHGVYSLHHKLSGSLKVNGQEMDFMDGLGYIEGDMGTSFPNGYFWCQSNDFDTKTSIMMAVASIPYLKFNFTGTICCVYYQGKEYRIATYNGAKVPVMSDGKVVITQGKLRLEADYTSKNAYPLAAPIGGKMARTIYESACATVHYKLFEKGIPIFNITSKRACLEYVSIDNVNA